MNNISVRVRFAKLGRSKYISHLDLIRCFQRAVCRAGLPAAYSAGFHPHMQTSFAATLPLGFTSTAEVMELSLSEPVPPEEVLSRLNAALPSDIRILEAGAPQHTFRELAYATYTVELPCGEPEALAKQFDAFLAQPEILVQKRSKKGMREVDLKPMIEQAEAVPESQQLVLHLCLPSGSSSSLNPMLLLHALEDFVQIPLRTPRICRTALLTAEKTKFF